MADSTLLWWHRAAALVGQRCGLNFFPFFSFFICVFSEDDVVSAEDLRHATAALASAVIVIEEAHEIQNSSDEVGWAEIASHCTADFFVEIICPPPCSSDKTLLSTLSFPFFRISSSLGVQGIKFRSFVCSALNAGQLHAWFDLTARLATHHKDLKKWYAANSLMRSRESLSVTIGLRGLSRIVFNMPVNHELSLRAARR